MSAGLRVHREALSNALATADEGQRTEGYPILPEPPDWSYLDRTALVRWPCDRPGVITGAGGGV